MPQMVIKAGSVPLLFTPYSEPCYTRVCGRAPFPPCGALPT
jgi:hypothetical protein